MARWADAASQVERWLLPAACLACRAPITAPDEPLVCDVCRARWRSLMIPVCGICGEPMPLGLACRICAEWPPEVGPVRSAVRLDANVRPLVHRFKYHGWWRLAGVFARRMAPLLASFEDADLVPVPLAAGRRRMRGYNQAEQLALALGAITGRPVRADRLTRIRETPTQTRLTPESRRANLAAAFSATGGTRPVILIDDVFTTGATLLSAAAGLLDAGAGQVGAVTFARAELALATD